MQLKRRRKILGEATMALNASQRLATGKSTEGMLQLKEKLAQSLINIAEKDREIAELREECDKQCEANS